jgi:glycosyltransferase involved in cell wall biosynthesis
VLVPPEDPAALAAELSALLTDPARARAIAEAGRQEARDRYDWSAVAAQVRDVYGDAVERSRAAKGS